MRFLFLQFIFGLFLPLVFFFSQAQGTSCESLEPFCAGDQELVFENANFLNSNQTVGVPGPDYGCLLSQPYPAWFYLQIEEDGNLEFLISQFRSRDGSGPQYDVDFIVWGPFSRTDDYCSDDALSANNIIDCSYAPDAVEQMTITNAEAGDIYVVLITNFETQPGYISLRQTNSQQSGSGSTDCTILESALGDDRVLCGESETVLDGTTEGATGYEWYFYNEDQGEYEFIPGEEEPTLTVTESGNYMVLVIDELNDDTDQDDINVNFYPEPIAIEPADLALCGDSGEVNLTVLEDEILAEAQPDEPYRVLFYENNDALENNEAINNPANFQVENETSLLAVVEGVQSQCTSDAVEVNLVPQEFEEIAWEEQVVLCADLTGKLIAPVEIGENLGPDFEYEWFLDNEPVSTEAIFVFEEIPSSSEIGLQLTDLRTGCSDTFTSEITIFSPPATVTVDIEGNDFQEGYIVIANVEDGFVAGGEYEFRLDDGPWQESNIFRRVPPGVHQITTRELNGCGETTSEEFDLIGYPRFFTPNSDGHNDTWHIQGSEEIRVLALYIFDRYGKLLKQLDPGGAGWDGTLGGRELPADDYWFKLQYRDLNSSRDREFAGHFTLKR